MDESIIVDKGYRLTRFSKKDCSRYCLSIGFFSNRAEAARFKHTVTDNGYR